jgi:hypothetical protein
MFIDPLSMKLDGVHVLAPKERDDFEALKNEMDEALDAIPLAEVAEDKVDKPEPDEFNE